MQTTDTRAATANMIMYLPHSGLALQ
jgi:hypothetical protein